MTNLFFAEDGVKTYKSRGSTSSIAIVRIVIFNHGGIGGNPAVQRYIKHFFALRPFSSPYWLATRFFRENPAETLQANFHSVHPGVLPHRGNERRLPCSVKWNKETKLLSKFETPV